MTDRKSPTEFNVGTLSDWEQIVRKYINMPRRHHALNGDPGRFNRLCSALDVVGDTEVAVESYLRDKWPEGIGPAYVQVYGILQMLVVQQDAVEEVAETLEVNYPRDNPDLKRIRELRNASVGHPAGLRGKHVLYDKNSAGFISRGSLRRDRFDLHVSSSEGLSSSKFLSISVPDLIETQYEILNGILSDACGRLREDEMNHRKRFADRKVEDVFHPSLGYCFQKVYQAISADDALQLGMSHIKIIRETANNFRSALSDRGEWQHTRSIQEEFSSCIECPLDELAKYFSDKAAAYLNERSAYVFVDFLERRFEGLKMIAREIDATYKLEPPSPSTANSPAT